MYACRMLGPPEQAQAPKHQSRKIQRIGFPHGESPISMPLVAFHLLHKRTSDAVALTPGRRALWQWSHRPPRVGGRCGSASVCCTIHSDDALEEPPTQLTEALSWLVGKRVPGKSGKQCTSSPSRAEAGDNATVGACARTGERARQIKLWHHGLLLVRELRDEVRGRGHELACCHHGRKQNLYPLSP